MSNINPDAAAVPVERTGKLYVPASNTRRALGFALLAIGLAGAALFTVTLVAIDKRALTDVEFLNRIGTKIGRAATGTLIGVSALVTVGGVYLIFKKKYKGALQLKVLSQPKTEEVSEARRYLVLTAPTKREALSQAKDIISQLSKLLKKGEVAAIAVLDNAQSDLMTVDFADAQDRLRGEDNNSRTFTLIPFTAKGAKVTNKTYDNAEKVQSGLAAANRMHAIAVTMKADNIVFFRPVEAAV